MRVISTLRGIRGHLKRECKKAGSVSEWAKENGFSRSYITEVLKGTYDPTKSERLMEALRLVKGGVWFKIGEEKPTRKEIHKFVIEQAKKDLEDRRKLGKMYDWKD